MTRTLTADTPAQTGQKVTVQGWVHSRRDHGGLIFVDLRDHTGLVQLVFNPDHASVFSAAGELRDEYVIEASGQVTAREAGLVNDKLVTGGIEIVVEDMRLLNRADTLPIQPFSEQQAGEDLRLKYRYLDLRRPKMQRILKRRADYYQVIRKYMGERDFTEVATPILANSSP